MTKNKISIEKTISDLQEIFNTKDNEFGTIEKDGKFLIHKKQFQRFQVIEILKDYFLDKFIDNGQCSISSLTMVFTTFQILKT